MKQDNAHTQKSNVVPLRQVAAPAKPADEPAVRLVAEVAAKMLRDYVREREADNGLCEWGCGAAPHEPRDLPKCPAYLAETEPERRMVDAMIERAAVADRDAFATALVAKLGSAVPAALAVPAATSGETVAKYAERWLKSRELKVTSIRDDRSRLRDHVLPIVGALDVATFVRDDVENVRDALDAKIVSGALNWKTARNAWGTFIKLCDDSANAKRRDLRMRTDNPATGVRAPDRGLRKAKQYLFPNEVLRFVECEDVPLTWRRNVAVAIYLYMRDGELRELRWDDVDLEHALVNVTHAYNRRTKTSKAPKTDAGTRRVPIHENLLPLLRAMHAESKGDGLVLPLSSERTMARALRRWLRRSGVLRDELFEASPTRKPITWHDMRASGITWLAITGLDATKIQRRAGHTTAETTLGYIREAESFAGDAFGVPFPALPAALYAASPSTVLAAGAAKTVDGFVGGADGARTRGLRRDRPAL